MVNDHFTLVFIINSGFLVLVLENSYLAFNIPYTSPKTARLYFGVLQLEGYLVDEVVSQYTWCIVTGAGGLAWIVLQYRGVQGKKLYCKRRLEWLVSVLQYTIVL